MLYILKTKCDKKLYNSENLNEIYMFIFNSDINIKAYIQEKNKEMIYILTDNSTELSISYILNNYKIFISKI